jgi:hypothetical protein
LIGEVMDGEVAFKILGDFLVIFRGVFGFEGC